MTRLVQISKSVFADLNIKPGSWKLDNRKTDEFENVKTKFRLIHHYLTFTKQNLDSFIII